MRLKGKVAVVTGAARGVGREIALLFAKQGARVVVNDYGGSEAGLGADRKPADEVVDEIRRAGGKAVASYDSVDSPEGGKAIVDTAVEAFGGLDAVISNAGIGDLDELIGGDRVGVILGACSRESYRRALTEMARLSLEPGIAERCRDSARNRFDLVGVGAVRYRRLYQRIFESEARECSSAPVEL